MAASGTVTNGFELTQILASSSTRPESVAMPVRVTAPVGYSAGTGSKQIDKIAYQALSFTGAVQTIDLSTIVCTDGSAGFSKVRFVRIYNDATNAAHTLVVGNAASNPLAPWFSATTVTETVEPNGCFTKDKPLGTTGWTVDSTNKNLKLDPGANTFTGRLFVGGN